MMDVRALVRWPAGCRMAAVGQGGGVSRGDVVRAAARPAAARPGAELRLFHRYPRSWPAGRGLVGGAVTSEHTQPVFVRAACGRRFVRSPDRPQLVRVNTKLMGQPAGA